VRATPDVRTPGHLLSINFVMALWMPGILARVQTKKVTVSGNILQMDH